MPRGPRRPARLSHGCGRVWRGPEESCRLGACHAVDLPFAFDTTTHPAAQPLLGTHPPRTLASRVHAAWMHFARRDHPD
jgi:para-nitrobenzyl esterase